MQLVVFHGSDKIIKMPQHNGGRKFSDFGLGFYITTNVEMAKSWATRKMEFIRRKYRKIGKYFDEIGVEDIHG